MISPVQIMLVVDPNERDGARMLLNQSIIIQSGGEIPQQPS